MVAASLKIAGFGHWIKVPKTMQTNGWLVLSLVLYFALNLISLKKLEIQFHCIATM